MITPEYLLELERLCREATGGKWVVTGTHVQMQTAISVVLPENSEGYSHHIALANCCVKNHYENAAFIAASREALPRLIEEVKRYKESWEDWEKRIAQEGDNAKADLREARKELAVARERLGPAGYKILKEVSELRQYHTNGLCHDAGVCAEMNAKNNLELIEARECIKVLVEALTTLQVYQWSHVAKAALSSESVKRWVERTRGDE